jgi:hypothetical protein
MYKINQTGPNIQAGGENDGLSLKLKYVSDMETPVN